MSDGWRQISVGARKGMWRYSKGGRTLLLADHSHPDDPQNVELLREFFGEPMPPTSTGQFKEKGTL